MKRLLIVDDDYDMRVLLQQTLKKLGYDTHIAKDGKTTLELLRADKYDLIVADLKMPEMDGIELLTMVRDNYPDTGFLIITAHGTIEAAVRAIQKGAHDFITKPFTVPQIVSKVNRYFDFVSLQEENKAPKQRLSVRESSKRLVVHSRSMKEIFHLINVISNSDAPVFIQGETGTGKELIAHSVHTTSSRADKPFLKINCSAIPATLFESILFGHEKGAFTDAHRSRSGAFEEANGGSLLLDEISDLPLTMQPKLLRVLQEATFTRVGSTAEIPVDVRIIATSNRNVRRMIEDGDFRADLFFRLNVIPITTPALRDRPEDIPALLEHFLKIFQKQYGYKRKLISNDALNVLARFNWPGNVRQLENVVERAILFSGDDETLTQRHFSLHLERIEGKEDIVFDGPACTLAEMERKLIYATLRKTNNNRTRAAKSLGISPPTLRSKIRLYESKTDPEMEQS